MKHIILSIALIISAFTVNAQNTNKITDLNNRVAGIDGLTHTIQTIDYSHHEIHSGSHFYVCNFETLGNGDSIVFAITTPDTEKWIHMTFEVSSTSRAEFYIYEDADVSGGTASLPFNNNRNSSNASVSVLARDPSTTTDTGTRIFAQSKGIEGTGFFGAASEGITERDNEIILKQNSTYRFVIVSRDAGQIVSYCGEWYEHLNK